MITEHEKTGITEELIQSNISNNLNYLMSKYGYNQKTLAGLLEIAPANLNKVVNRKQMPGLYPFLVKVRDVLHVSIDDFVMKDLSLSDSEWNIEEESTGSKLSRKYTGLFQLYYFDTSAYKGRERHSDAKALKSGILNVTQDDNDRKLSVVAFFDLKKEVADQLYKELSALEESARADYIHTLSSSIHAYEGNMEITSQYIYIYAEYLSKDKMLAIFHNPDSTSDSYIGGLGAIVSVSKGRNRNPCVQYLGLSRNSLGSSKEEIATHLLLHYPNIKTYDTLDGLIEMIHSFYTEEGDILGDDQKKLMIRFHIDKIVNETVEKNLMRTVIVSTEDDDEFYHYIKQVTAR